VAAVYRLHLLAHIVHQPAEHQAQLTQAAQGHADLIHAVHAQHLAAGAAGHRQGLLAQQLQGPRQLTLQQQRHHHGRQRTHTRPGRQLGGAADQPAGQAQAQPQPQHVQAYAAAHRQGLAQGEQRLPAPVQQHALVQPHAAGPPLAHLAVQGLGRVHLLPRGLGPHRHIARVAPITHHRHRIGAHPVVIAVLAPVLHQGRPGLATLDGGPHIGKCLGRHIGVAHQIVGLAPELLAAEAAGRHEGVIGIAHMAAGVGGRHQGAVIGQRVLALRDGRLLGHGSMESANAGRKPARTAAPPGRLIKNSERALALSSTRTQAQDLRGPQKLKTARMAGNPAVVARLSGQVSGRPEALRPRLSSGCAYE